MAALAPHLRRLEAEAIHILRETVASFRNPVLLFSGGKDSTVVLHLARKAFAPGGPKLPARQLRRADQALRTPFSRTATSAGPSPRRAAGSRASGRS